MAERVVAMVDIHEMLRLHGQLVCGRVTQCHLCPIVGLRLAGLALNQTITREWRWILGCGTSGGSCCWSPLIAFRRHENRQSNTGVSFEDMSIAEFDVAGQKVLLVGAGRGIGKGIAQVFAEAGADVAITGMTSTGASKVAEEARALGRQAIALAGDATKSADMDRIAEQVLAEFGHVDTLVNCVGDSIRKPVVKLPGTDLEGMTESDWHHVVGHKPDRSFPRVPRPRLPHAGARPGLRDKHLRLGILQGKGAILGLRRRQDGVAAFHRVLGAGMGALRRPGKRHRAGHLPGPRTRLLLRLTKPGRNRPKTMCRWVGSDA